MVIPLTFYMCLVAWDQWDLDETERGGDTFYLMNSFKLAANKWSCRLAPSRFNYLIIIFTNTIHFLIIFPIRGRCRIRLRIHFVWWIRVLSKLKQKWQFHWSFNFAWLSRQVSHLIERTKEDTSGAIHRYVPVSAVITPWLWNRATPKSATFTTYIPNYSINFKQIWIFPNW